MIKNKDGDFGIDNNYEYRFDKAQTIKKYLENKKKIRAKYKSLDGKNYIIQELYYNIMNPSVSISHLRKMSTDYTKERDIYKIKDDN